ncbi:MAG: KamA family protein [Tannerellaceae bacterium]|jgi:lysine 2,3-aminomutase|nr:KamA family protein [Tannerellaceae bacterium]
MYNSSKSVRELFDLTFPNIVTMAKQSDTAHDFKLQLRIFIASQPAESRVVKERIIRMIDYDNTFVDELSTGEQLPIKTITLLWLFLNNSINENKTAAAEAAASDLWIDLYHQFELLLNPNLPIPSYYRLRKQMGRWPTGLKGDVIAMREVNRERIIGLLVKKIEHRSSLTQYRFDEGMTQDDKYNKVREWWNESRFHLTMAVKSPTELNAFLDNSLSPDTMQLLARARKKQMPFFVTPYYLSLLNTGEGGYDDATIRSYVIYSGELVDEYGAIKAWEREDIVVDNKPNAAGWLLPDGNNIHRRYPEVAILIPDSMGRACGGLCAPCQRMYDFQSRRLNFDFEALRPKESWDRKLRRLMQYFEDDTQLRDILITGGDALMSRNETLRNILDAVYKMAARKKKANMATNKTGNACGNACKAEIQRVRLGTRLPVYLPMRITESLAGILREFKDKAATVGITQCYIQTHFQSPLEVTPESRRAIEILLDAGWTVTNQMVYTVAASRRGHAACLRRALNAIGVVSYYTFSVKGFRENYAMFAPNSRLLQAGSEEKVFGIIPPGKIEDLHAIIQDKKPLGRHLLRFLSDNGLPFAGTDRNVLNLPGIGKSMTFVTVGITGEGKRILRFEHDASRFHSPIINRIKEVYIVENKSLAAYLRQLEGMGEDMAEYSTIWNYCEGVTEPRFPLYEYPPFPFKLTDKITNIDTEI